MRRFLAWMRRHRWGLIVGAGVTLAIMGLHAANQLALLARLLLDVKFRHFNSLTADPSIVMIDINDFAVDRVHSWPWPRDLHADLIQTLHELGARAILMDIVFSEPKGGRVDDPRLDADYDVDPAEVVGEFDLDNIVREDDRLAQGLQEAGNVYLAMFAALYHPRYSPAELRERTFAILDERADISLAELDASLVSGGKTMSGRAKKPLPDGRGSDDARRPLPDGRGSDGPLAGDRGSDNVRRPLPDGRGSDNIGLSEFARRSETGRDRLGVRPNELFDELRIEHLVTRNFAADASVISKRLAIPPARVDQYLAPAKRIASRRVVREFLTQESQASFRQVYEHFIPGKSFDVFSADREDLKRAYRAVMAERAIVDATIAVDESLEGRIPYADDLTPPVEKFARSAHAGLVTFQTDPVDGVMRRVPLVVNFRGHLLKHLGLAVVGDVLGIDQGSIRFEDGQLVMESRDRGRAWRVPVEPSGRTLINWHFDPDNPQWTGSFTHIPVSRIMAIPRLRRAIEDEEAILAYRMQEFVRLRASDAAALLDQYQQLVRERRALRRGEETPRGLKSAARADEAPRGLKSAARENEALPRPADTGEQFTEDRSLTCLRAYTHRQAVAARIAEIEEQIARIETDSVNYVVNVLAPDIRKFVDSGGTLSEDCEEDRQARRVLELADEYATDSGDGSVERGTARTKVRGALGASPSPFASIRRAIAEKRTEIESLRGELGPLLEGKICLVGYTAAAVADTVNTPVYKEMPGVLAHANVINTFLTDRFPRSAPHWANRLLIVLCGLIITVITTWRDPWASLLAVVAMIAIVLATAFAAFYAWTVQFEAEGAAIAAFTAWAMVTLYRQLTEERHKRAFSKSLAQYTSPAIAEQLAARMTQRGPGFDLSPVPRQVTCYFSDLKGFTSISERLGAARTRDVLNPYLESMSQVLIESGAMINKFMGDGIFAFFNPPILPVEEHARRGCEAALRSFEALERLKRDFSRSEIEQEVGTLSMRIGLHTGEVFVGDYGSASKLDYTCIGDTVNLTARLEPACKIFGVACMISESTYAPTGDRFVVRHLGSLQVVGKSEAVQVYELIGRRGETDGGQESYAALFGQAVERFQQRDWDGALAVLERCRQARPDDAAISLLTDNIRRYQESPPADDWNQAIELTTK